MEKILYWLTSDSTLTRSRSLILLVVIKKALLSLEEKEFTIKYLATQ